MQIQKATTRDLNAVCRLLSGLLTDLSVYQPFFYRRAQIPHAFFQRELSSRRAEILVARQDGAVIGFVYLRQRRTPRHGSLVPHRYGVLTELAVDPRWRSRGVGTALIRASRQWAICRGLDYLELSVLPQNVKAVSLYRKEGFVPVQTVMRTLL